MPGLSARHCSGGRVSAPETLSPRVSLVLNRLADPYRPGARGWRKYRSRHTTEVLVGAVTGRLDHPDRLVLALPAPDELRIVGGTVTLTDSQAREVGARLRTPVGPHPWPTTLPTGRTGVGNRRTRGNPDRPRPGR